MRAAYAQRSVRIIQRPAGAVARRLQVAQQPLLGPVSGIQSNRQSRQGRILLATMHDTVGARVGIRSMHGSSGDGDVHHMTEKAPELLPAASRWYWQHVYA